MQDKKSTLRLHEQKLPMNIRDTFLGFDNPLRQMRSLRLNRDTLYQRNRAECWN